MPPSGSRPGIGAGSRGRVVEVRNAYGLTVDRREAAALDRIFAGCASTGLEPVVCVMPSGSSRDSGRWNAAGDDALARYDDNRNGKITCKGSRPARHCPGLAVARGVPVHARRGWGWRGVRISLYLRERLLRFPPDPWVAIFWCFRTGSFLNDGI